MYEKFKRCTSIKYTHVENHGSYAVRWEDNKMYLYFQKSNGKVDWLNNFRFLAIPTKPYKDMDKGEVWFCHRGFMKVWKSIEPYIKDDILDPGITEIEVVGYSHGAALAQLCYEYIKYNRPDVVVSGYGFGAPRVFWGIATEAVKKRFEGFLVVRNGHDAVTHLPPAIFGYWHICEVLNVGEHWTFKDFVDCVRIKGLKKALKESAHLGSIKDHYPQLYTLALTEENEPSTDEKGA